MLSILIPVYNEKYTLGLVVEKVAAASLPDSLAREIIVVDDGSTDGTAEVARELALRFSDVVRVVFHEENRGKGAAIRTAIEHATGDLAVIQDADLEYNPEEIERLILPILRGHADVVYGSRFASGEYRRVLYFWHSVANKALTLFSNMLTDLNLTDMETCYKAARLGLLKSIPIRCDRFGIEPELTAKFAKRNARIFEIPISYRGRTYQEGKKVGWWDGVKAVYIMMYFAVVDDAYQATSGHDILHSLSRTPRFNRWMADTIRPYVGDEILEIGAGIGNLTDQLLPRTRYVVSDIDPIHLDTLMAKYDADPRVDIMPLDLMDAGQFDRVSEQFDTVVCFNVVEHIEDDLRAMKNLVASLKPGGTAVILVPYGAQYFCTFDEVLEHFRRYDDESIARLGRDAGLEIEHTLSFNKVSVPGWVVNGKWLKRKTFSRFQLRVFDRLVWLWKILERVLPWHGLSTILIARKPG